jgi:hypothetical protein
MATPRASLAAMGALLRDGVRLGERAGIGASMVSLCYSRYSNIAIKRIAMNSESMRTIPAFKLILEPADDEASELLDCHRDVAGINQRHRLGGKPEFIEGEEIPLCAFGSPMTFYAQLDSVSEEFSLADRGMIYVFVCFNCLEAKAVLQSY